MLSAYRVKSCIKLFIQLDIHDIGKHHLHEHRAMIYSVSVSLLRNPDINASDSGLELLPQGQILIGGNARQSQKVAVCAGIMGCRNGYVPEKKIVGKPAHPVFRIRIDGIVAAVEIHIHAAGGQQKQGNQNGNESGLPHLDTPQKTLPETPHWGKVTPAPTPRKELVPTGKRTSRQNSPLRT